MNETKCVRYVPPCCLKGDKWLDLETGKYFYPAPPPVYVRIRGRRREAKRCLWLWRIVANIQEELE